MKLERSTSAQPLESPWEEIEKIARDETRALGCELCGAAVCDCRRRGSELGVETLGEKCARDSRQHIAGSGGRKRGRAEIADDRPASG